MVCAYKIMQNTTRIYNLIEFLTIHESFQSEALLNLIPSRSEGVMKYFEGEMGFTPHSLGEGVLCFRVSGTIFLNFPWSV